MTWHDSSQGVGGAEGDTDGYAIKAQIFDDSGMKVGPEILVNTTTSGYQVTPNIAVTSSGGFAIGWMDYDVASSTAAVTQMFAADGTRIGGETRLSVSAQVSEFNLTLIGLVDDRVFVAWPSDSDVAAQLMGIAPVVTGVEAPTDGTHAFGAELAFTVTFDEDVTVAGGTPRLAIDIGGVTRYATYVSGSPGTTLTFKYTVAGGDTDTDGIEIVGLEANGATLMSAGDHPALLTLHGLPATGAILVRGDQPPVIDGLTGNAEFVEGLNEPSEAVVVAADITVTDGDSESLASATVSITGTFRAGEDKLDFVNGPGMGDIQGAYNAATGVLTLTSAGGATPAEFQAALRAVTYINTSETPYSADRTLTFQVSDGAATSLAATRTLKVVEMDDTPSGADKALSMNEDSDHVFGAGDFGFSDTDGGTLRGVTLTTLPNVGAITLDGAAVTAGQVVTRADIDAGKLAFRGPLNGAGDDLASFTFQVMDDLGEDYIGQAVDQSPNTITFSLTAVSDAPSGIDATVTAGQDASRALTVADFGFSDVDGDTLAAVKIIALPAHGALTLNAVAVTANQTIPAADIAAGKLVFVPQAGQFGAAYATITFQVQDTGSTTNGGENLDLSFNTLTLDVTEAPPEPPPTTPATPTVDGVPVTTTPGTSPSGTPTQTVTVPVVQPGRTDSVGGNNVADIPIVTESGATLLSVQAPAGYGLTASGPAEPKTAGTSLTDLIREIQAHTSSGSTDQTLLTGGGSGFLGALTTSTPLLVQTVVPTGGGAGAAPLVINGTAATGDAMTALVIDTRGLPSGSTLQLNNVDFAAVVGAVTVTGGAGSQIVYGDGASQTLFLGADDDELHGGGGTDTVASAAGADRLYGDDGSDSVSGGIGDDVVHGNAGADTVSGGEGADRAYGGKDNDRVTGDGGHDLIFGDLGDDFLQGNAGTDSLDGGAGNDTVHGGQDNDQVTGGDGNDAVLGDAGDDAIQGGLGNDTATGGIGADLIHGGQGNDILYGEADQDVLDGGTENDALYGGDYHDRLIGGLGADHLEGGDGDDYLSGGLSSQGGLGDDYIDGGDGIDRVGYFTYLGGAGVTVSLLSQGGAQNTGSQGIDTLVGIENLSATSFADTLIGDQNANWLWGGQANFRVNPATLVT
ncbi:MAG: hypothetical protein ABW360_15855, partial [Phenylobacterium sp.]